MQHKLKIWDLQQCYKYQKAIARLQNNEIKEENLMNKLKKIDSIMNMLSGKIKAELKLQDATGAELVLLI
jgi:hypothetical protein